MGNGLDSDIDTLENIIEQELREDPSASPILALFTEFPSNPLLRSPNIPRLRALADKYDFLLIIDDTIGNFVNIEALPYADITVSSLSKIFSGCANTMGGRYAYGYFLCYDLLIWILNTQPCAEPPRSSLRCTETVHVRQL